MRARRVRYRQHVSLNVIIVLNIQWLKCNETQGNAVPPPPIYDSKRSLISNCYNAKKRRTTTVKGPNINTKHRPLDGVTGAVPSRYTLPVLTAGVHAFPTSNFVL